MVRACANGAGQPAEMDLFKFLEHPDVLVLDVRSREEYDRGHIGMVQCGALLAVKPLEASPFYHHGPLSIVMYTIELNDNSCDCPGTSKHIPVNEIPERLEELPSDLETPICCFCKIGQRSGLAKRFLEQVGARN